MPTGGLDALAVGALVGAATGGVEAAASGKSNPFPDILGGAVGGGLSGGLAGPIGGLVGGDLGGIAGGVAAGAIGGGADALISGQKFGPSVLTGGALGGIGAGLSGLVSGPGGGLFGGTPSAAGGAAVGGDPGGGGLLFGGGTDLTSSAGFDPYAANISAPAYTSAAGGATLPSAGLAPGSAGAASFPTSLTSAPGVPISSSGATGAVGAAGTPGVAPIDPTKAAWSNFTSNPSLGGAFDVAKSAITDHPLSLLSAGGLAATALRGNQGVGGMKQLEAQAATVQANAQALTNSLNGQLPPLASTALKSASNSAKAAARSYLASNGLSNSTLAASMESAIDANLAQQTFDIATKLVSQGVDLSQISSNMWTQILQANTTQNNALMQSIASFSAGLVPNKAA